MSLPKDPIILLSVINTNLRDNYSNLDELCKSMDADKEDLIQRLGSIGYAYDEATNSFK